MVYLLLASSRVALARPVPAAVAAPGSNAGSIISGMGTIKASNSTSELDMFLISSLGLTRQICTAVLDTSMCLHLLYSAAPAAFTARGFVNRQIPYV